MVDAPPQRGVKTRVASLPPLLSRVGFPSWPRAWRRGAGMSEPERQRPAGRAL